MENIIEFIHENRSFFYEEIQTYYRNYYFKDNRGERLILSSINDSNCRYNACLLYCISYLRRYKSIKIEDILTTYSDRFINFVIHIFKTSFFQDDFTEDDLELLFEGRESKNSDENVIMYLFEDETFYGISHIMTYVKEGNHILLIDAYGTNKYKRPLEIRKVNELNCSAYLPKDNCLDKDDIPYHYTKDAIIYQLPYEYLDMILKPNQVYKQVLNLGGKKNKTQKKRVKNRKIFRKIKSNKLYTRNSNRQ